VYTAIQRCKNAKPSTIATGLRFLAAQDASLFAEQKALSEARMRDLEAQPNEALS
jgi:hypothetical protein